MREAEIRLGQKAGSAVDTVKNWFQRPATGKSLTSSQRQAIVEAVKIMGERSREQYLSGISPIVRQAEDEKVGLDKVLDADINEYWQKRNKYGMNERGFLNVPGAGASPSSGPAPTAKPHSQDNQALKWAQGAMQSPDPNTRAKAMQILKANGL